MRYRVVRHHEMDVNATDEEDARSKGVGMVPYRVSVTPLDLEALSQYRQALLKSRAEALEYVADAEKRIAEVEKEMRDVQAN